MNARVAFDTHAFVKRLEAAGMSVPPRRGARRAMGDIVLQSIATKTDLRELEINLRAELKDLELRLTLRTGVMIAAAVAILGALNFFT